MSNCTPSKSSTPSGNPTSNVATSKVRGEVPCITMTTPPPPPVKKVNTNG